MRVGLIISRARMSRTVVLTGASGFVGRAVLAQLCAQGYFVHAVARHMGRAQAGVQWHAADLRAAQGRGQVAGLAPLMIHCAWDVTHGAFWTSDANAAWREASRDLADRFYGAGGEHLLALGTCAEYEARSPLPWNEARPIDPATPYGAAKAALHGDLMEMSGAAQGLTWARLFHMFGEGEDARRLIPSLIGALREGRPAVVRSAQLVRDFASTAHVARALVALLDARAVGDYDIGSGQGHTLGEIAQMLAQHFGPAAVVELGYASGPNDAEKMVPELAKLRAATGLGVEDTRAALAALIARA
jgi:nucleoside-diphosphate-sugar epimerase